MRALKRKLSTYADEETRLYKQLDARVAHLRELSDMHSVEDVKYEAWSRKRLDRLLVDYMLRHGYNTSAQALANEREMHDLVDVETFLAMSKIKECLENGSVSEALVWCANNKKELRKLQVRRTAQHPQTFLPIKPLSRQEFANPCFPVQPRVPPPLPRIYRAPPHQHPTKVHRSHRPRQEMARSLPRAIPR